MFPTSDAFNTETGEINLESRDTSKVSGHSFVLKATVRDIYVESSFTVSYLRECVETSIIPPNQVTQYSYKVLNPTLVILILPFKAEPDCSRAV